MSYVPYFRFLITVCDGYFVACSTETAPYDLVPAASPDTIPLVPSFKVA